MELVVEARQAGRKPIHHLLYLIGSGIVQPDYLCIWQSVRCVVAFSAYQYGCKYVCLVGISLL